MNNSLTALRTKPMNDTGQAVREKVEAAIKTTEYKYFGCYELASDQEAAVETLADFARAALANLAPEAVSNVEAGAPICPFCHEQTQVTLDDIEGWIGYVSCTGCDMRGPISEWKYEDQDEAKADGLKRWYKGFAPTDAEAMRAEWGQIRPLLTGLISDVECAIDYNEGVDALSGEAPEEARAGIERMDALIDALPITKGEPQCPTPPA